MNLDTRFVPDLEEGHKRLSGQPLIHFKSRVAKAAHILEELTSVGIDPQAPNKALFAGSGLSFIPYILARHTAWDIFAGDLNASDLYKNAWIRDRINLAHLDLTAMPYPDNAFDVVVCNHVIEHVPAWEAVARELYRVVKKGGVVYLATPNLYRPDAPMNVLWRKKKNVPRHTRIDLHMGFSMPEIEHLLADFARLDKFNRTHVLINSPAFLRLPLSLVPARLYDRFAPNNVVIAHK